jgi:L-asparaginase/Glu-tRNA(Gln) amidotransferase subunit D
MRLAQWLDVAAPMLRRKILASTASSSPTAPLPKPLTFFTSACMRKPLVIVASQRKHDEVGNDGDRNLLDAIRLVLTPEARGKGVLVTLHEEIHSAREVVKTNQRPGGFHSLGRGILGHIEDDQVSFYATPIRRHTFRSEFNPRDRRIAAHRCHRRLRRWR